MKTKKDITKSLIDKEQEPMEEKPFECIDFAKHPPIADKLEIILGDREIIQENGKYYVVKKKPKYPKTFKECRDVLGIMCDDYVCGYKGVLLRRLQQLLTCRDAYWKIAGGWKEKRKDKDEDEAVHYVIYSTLLDGVIKEATPNCIANYLLDFPTAEIRDAFYDNFKDLIEECKELL